MTFRSVYTVLFLCMSAVLSSCFKNLPSKQVVYQTGFEEGRDVAFKVFDAQGVVDSAKTFPFNGSLVFGRFNNNLVQFKLESLPGHNTVRIEFDLFIHGKWEGDHLSGTGIPDVWQMQIDGYTLYLTTFSNTSYTQSFPDNFKANVLKNPAHANAWELLPGVCASESQPDGTAHYKIDVITGHSSANLLLSINDALQPAFSQCVKSWSIDNFRITASNY